MTENAKDILPILSMIIAVFAVFVGPLISFKIANKQLEASSKQANKQIIAPIRQTWIENLRELLSEFLSLAHWYYLSGAHDHSTDRAITDDEEAWDDQRSKAERRLLFLEKKIALMLNPREQDHEQLLKHLSVCATAALSPAGGFVADYEAASELSKQILKREWERVKNET